MPTEPEYGQRIEGSALSGVLGTVTVVGSVLAGFIAWHPAYDLDTLRDFTIGQDPVEPVTVPSTYESGQFTYAMTQPDGISPVGFDPCQTVEIAINPDGAPSGFREMVNTSVERTTAATGLTMKIVGETQDRNFTQRGPNDVVLVAWADADEVPELAGDVRGLGGSTSIQQGNIRRYVSGMVVIDTDSTGFNLKGSISQAIMDHEFGHLVGLGHIDDPEQLMNPIPTQTSYGPGDLQGLASLGDIPCA